MSIIFLAQCPKYILLSLPNLKKIQILFGGQSDSCVAGDKKAKSGSSGALEKGTCSLLTFEYNHVCTRDRAINIF